MRARPHVGCAQASAPNAALGPFRFVASVRKLTRAIIETVGGDGAAVRNDVDADYYKGVVRCKEEKIAEFKDQAMDFTAAGGMYESAFRILMGT